MKNRMTREQERAMFARLGDGYIPRKNVIRSNRPKNIGGSVHTSNINTGRIGDKSQTHVAYMTIKGRKVSDKERKGFWAKIVQQNCRTIQEDLHSYDAAELVGAEEHATENLKYKRVLTQEKTLQRFLRTKDGRNAIDNVWDAYEKREDDIVREQEKGEGNRDNSLLNDLRDKRLSFADAFGPLIPIFVATDDSNDISVYQQEEVARARYKWSRVPKGDLQTTGDMHTDHMTQDFSNSRVHIVYGQSKKDIIDLTRTSIKKKSDIDMIKKIREKKGIEIPDPVKFLKKR